VSEGLYDQIQAGLTRFASNRPQRGAQFFFTVEPTGGFYMKKGGHDWKNISWKSKNEDKSRKQTDTATVAWISMI
jgi:hypothetical protein